MAIGPTEQHRQGVPSHEPRATNRVLPARPDLEPAFDALVRQASDTEFDDPAWEDIRSDAQRLTTEAAVAGYIPEHLVVGPGDPPIVAARTIAAARRQWSPPGEHGAAGEAGPGPSAAEDGLEPGAAGETTGMRVVTLNVFGCHGDWDARRTVLRDGLRRLAPDLVALQETVRTDAYDQVVDLLGDEYHLVDHPGRLDRDPVGATLASRWPVSRVWAQPLKVSDRVTLPWAGTVVAEVEAPAPFGALLFAHHKPSWSRVLEHERELEAVAGARLVEEARGGRTIPTLVAGDFDAEPHSSSMRFWTGRQALDGTSTCHVDAWECAGGDRDEAAGHTFTPVNPLVRSGTMPLETGRRIDYILVGCDDHGPTLRTASCRRIFDEPEGGVWASDHFGVLAEIETVGTRSE